MDPVQLGAVFRAVRVRLHRRQADVARAAAVSTSTVSRIERGFLTSTALEVLIRVAAVLEMRIDLQARWRGGDLDRLLAAGHSAMHDEIACQLARLPGWIFAPEVTFAVFGERGVIDVLSFHPGSRTLLVIELKTQLVDVQALLGQVDRYRRLAVRVARERGWQARTVAVWVVMRDTMTNRRRVGAHAAVLRAALPDHAAALHRWLRNPTGPMAALTFLSDSHGRNVGHGNRAVKRIRRRHGDTPDRDLAPTKRLRAAESGPSITSGPGMGI